VLEKPGPLDADRIADLRPFPESVPDPRSRRSRSRWWLVRVRMGCGWCRTVSRAWGVEVLTPEYRRIMEIVTSSDALAMAKDVGGALGRQTTAAKVEPVRGQLHKLADRGWISRTGAGRYLTR
jgi:hypothetical protein